MKKIITLLAVLVSVSSAQAAADNKHDWSIGGLLGYGVGENSFGGFTWGAQVDYDFHPSWTGGIYWSNTKESPISVMPLMAQANYWFADLQGFHIGPRLGLTFTKSDLTASSSSDFTVGAQAGYDQYIAADWSLGVNANWNLILADDSSSLFNFVVPVTYHF